MASFATLIELLSDIYQAQLEMVEFAKRKKQILVIGKIDELSKVIQQESIWIKKVGKLEEERISVIQKIAQEKDFNSAGVTMTDLINLSDSPEEQRQLIDLQEKLNESFQEIQRLNALNTELIEQSLEYISHSLKLFTEEPKQSYTYTKPTPDKSTVQSRSFFDKKA